MLAYSRFQFHFAILSLYFYHFNVELGHLDLRVMRMRSDLSSGAVYFANVIEDGCESEVKHKTACLRD